MRHILYISHARGAHGAENGNGLHVLFLSMFKLVVEYGHASPYDERRSAEVRPKIRFKRKIVNPLGGGGVVAGHDGIYGLCAGVRRGRDDIERAQGVRSRYQRRIRLPLRSRNRDSCHCGTGGKRQHRND